MTTVDPAILMSSLREIRLISLSPKVRLKFSCYVRPGAFGPTRALSQLRVLAGSRICMFCGTLTSTCHVGNYVRFAIVSKPLTGWIYKSNDAMLGFL